MKTIGLIGGMSWESSLLYYQIINEETRRRLGGLHSAQSLMYSFDFAEIEALQHEDRWDEATERMVAAGESLKRGGADFALICTNTMHKMAAAVEEVIPLLHIADPTAGAITQQGIRTIGLLGTKYTMEQNFYKGRLTEKFGLEVVTPHEADRHVVHDIIYKELCLGKVRPESKKQYVEIIHRLGAQGAQGVILGCTEITMLVQQQDTGLPLFDTTRIHAEAAVSRALQ